MRLQFGFLTAFALCLFHTAPTAADEAETMAEVKAAVTEIEQAFIDQDVTTIERMFTPDHISIAERYSGAVHVPEQLETIDVLKRESFDLTPLDVRLLGADAALVTYQQSYSGTYEGKALPPRVFVSQIWLKQDGAWRQLLYQETQIPPP
jgi:ketosteroid isomerase-like protein